MASAVIGFGCLIKHVKIQRKKIWKKDWLENVIHSLSKTRLQIIYKKTKHDQLCMFIHTKTNPTTNSH